MRYWTCQNLTAYKKLQDDGVLWGCPNAIKNQWEEFLLPYDWMKEQMKVSLSTFSGHYPVWAWDFKPDLRHREFRSEEDHVWIEFETSRPVLASDFSLWHFPLNRMFLSLTPEEEKDFDEYVKEKYGKKVWFEEFDESDKQKMKDSWKHILNFETLISNPHVQYQPTDRKQYCVDGLYLNEVKNVRHVKGLNK